MIKAPTPHSGRWGARDRGGREEEPRSRGCYLVGLLLVRLLFFLLFVLRFLVVLLLFVLLFLVGYDGAGRRLEGAGGEGMSESERE
jgi:hypothetical protein